jgi:hypothetical protein
MKRQEFIDLWVRTVANGRKKNFPDISPAEAAAASVDDHESAKKMWRKYGVGRFKGMNENEVLKALGVDGTGK